MDEKRCEQSVLLLFSWGGDPNHEALVSDILARHDGDAIANAALTIEWVDAIVYSQTCARVKGDVVRRNERGARPADFDEEAPP